MIVQSFSAEVGYKLYIISTIVDKITIMKKILMAISFI